jgi:hypothetical protein
MYTRLTPIFDKEMGERLANARKKLGLLQEDRKKRARKNWRDAYHKLKAGDKP